MPNKRAGLRSQGLLGLRQGRGGAFLFMACVFVPKCLRGEIPADWERLDFFAKSVIGVRWKAWEPLRRYRWQFAQCADHSNGHCLCVHYPLLITSPSDRIKSSKLLGMTFHGELDAALNVSRAHSQPWHGFHCSIVQFAALLAPMINLRFCFDSFTLMEILATNYAGPSVILLQIIPTAQARNVKVKYKRASALHFGLASFD